MFKRPIAPVLVLVLLAVACNRADAGLQLTLKGGRATLIYADGSAGDTTKDTSRELTSLFARPVAVGHEHDLDASTQPSELRR